MFLSNNGSKAWLEICCGIKPTGEPYCNTSETAPLEIGELMAKNDEDGLRNYIAAEVRKFAAATGVEQISEGLSEFLPKGFSL